MATKSGKHHPVGTLLTLAVGAVVGAIGYTEYKKKKAAKDGTLAGAAPAAK